MLVGMTLACTYASLCVLMLSTVLQLKALNGTMKQWIFLFIMLVMQTWE